MDAEIEAYSRRIRSLLQITRDLALRESRA